MAIATALVEVVPRPSDERLVRVASEFPDYIATRYAAHGLKRIELIELAMKAHYVAADALRRVSEREFAGLLERDPRNPPRSFP